MRRKFLVILILFLYSTSGQPNENFYYSMKLRPSLYTVIQLQTSNDDLEHKFRKSQSIRVASSAYNTTLDVPIANDKILYASGILPFANDWVIKGIVSNGKLLKEFSYNKKIEQELSNISLESEYLGNNNIEIKATKLTCYNNKISFEPSDVDNNLFVLLTYGESERFVNQYYGKYNSHIEIDCPFDSVFLRYTVFP